MIAIIVAAATLAGAITATWPEIQPARAFAASLAISVEHGGHEPTLLAAIAYHESRFDPRATNGRCRGLMQVAGGPRADVFSQVRAGVRKLDEARAYCGVRYLNGYASGRCDHGRASARAFVRLARQLARNSADAAAR